ncbi:MAG: putative redox protein [Planctomycetota bacterium]|jgi:putative redox protein
MVQIKSTYEGSLRTRAVHGPSSTELITDAPVDNQGKGESFSPTDLVATALGTCMLTIMGIVAERHGWDLLGASVSVEKTMSADAPRRITELAVVITVPAVLDAGARKALEKAAHGCPVHATLGDRVNMPVEFVWG